MRPQYGLVYGGVKRNRKFVTKRTATGEPSGFSKLAAPLVSTAMRKSTQKDLARLKRLLEQGNG